MLILLALFLLVNNKTENHQQIVEKYPWQVSILADGKIQVFGIVLDETSLNEVDTLLKSNPKIELFDVNKTLSLEAYYKNVSLGGLIGSFIFTLNATSEQLNKLKNESMKRKPAENKGMRYELDKYASNKAKSLIIKNLIYIPTVQLDEKMIVKRFGKPAQKIKVKTKEISWHYLYPDKGLDVIYHEEGKEVLQYVLPKNFNLLIEPLQSVQSPKH